MAELWPEPPSHDVDAGSDDAPLAGLPGPELELARDEDHDAEYLRACIEQALAAVDQPRPRLRMAIDEVRVRGQLERIACGDSAAFTALYDETSPHLYAVLLRMLRDRDQAAEALQDCYIRIWRRSTTYRPERGDVAGWLVGIARYRAIDLVRSRLTHSTRLAAHASDLRAALVPPRSPEADALVATDLDRLSCCLEGLHEDQRRCLLLSFHEGYSNQELAGYLGLPLGTVKARIRRGLVRLRQCLEAKA